MGVSFRKGACGWCVRVAKWLPVGLVGAVVVWSYYAYVVHLCFLTVLTPTPSFPVEPVTSFPVPPQGTGSDVTGSGAETGSGGGSTGSGGWLAVISMLVPYHALLGLFLWSYFRTVLTPAGAVPARFRLSPQEMDEVESSPDPRAALEQLAVSKDVPVSMRSPQGEVRYCTECCHIKPDRTHHCSVCGHCVLKMDHHCPWVNNCVAFNNYKFFVLFLGYAVAYCLFVALTTLKYFLLFWTSAGAAASHGKFHVLFLFFVSGMFCLSLSSLFVYHMFLVSRNQTTLESFRAPIFRDGSSSSFSGRGNGAEADKKGFHLGTAGNFQEVFGDKKLFWPLPIYSSFGDGIVFPRREGSLYDLEEVIAAGGGSSGPHNFRHQIGVAMTPLSSNNGTTVLGSRRSGGSTMDDEMVPMMSSVRFDSETDEEDYNNHHNHYQGGGHATILNSRPPVSAGFRKLTAPNSHHHLHPLTSSDSSSTSLVDKDDNDEVAIIQVNSSRPANDQDDDDHGGFVSLPPFAGGRRQKDFMHKDGTNNQQQQQPKISAAEKTFGQGRDFTTVSLEL